MAERVDLPDTPIIPGGSVVLDLYWTMTLYLKGIFNFDEHLKEVTVQAKRTEVITNGEAATVVTSTVIYKKFRRTSQEARETLIDFDEKLLENDIVSLDFSYDDDYESSTPNYSETLGKPSAILKQNRIMLTASKVLKEHSRPKARYFVKHNDDYIGFDYSSVELGAEKYNSANNIHTGLQGYSYQNKFVLTSLTETKDILYNNYEAYMDIQKNPAHCIELPYYYNNYSTKTPIRLVKEGYLPKPFEFYFEDETIKYRSGTNNDGNVVCLKESGWLNYLDYTKDMHDTDNHPGDVILQIDRKSAYKQVNNAYVRTDCIAVCDITDPANKTYEYFSDADHIYYMTGTGRLIEFSGENHNVFSKIGYVPKCLTAIMCGGGGGSSTGLIFRADGYAKCYLGASGATGGGGAWCAFMLDFWENRNTFEIHLGCYGDGSSQKTTKSLMNSYTTAEIEKYLLQIKGRDGQKSYVYNIDKNKVQLATEGGKAGHAGIFTAIKNKDRDYLFEGARETTPRIVYNNIPGSCGFCKYSLDGGKTWENDDPLYEPGNDKLAECGIYPLTHESGGDGGNTNWAIIRIDSSKSESNYWADSGMWRGGGSNVHIQKEAKSWHVSSRDYSEYTLYSFDPNTIRNDSGNGGTSYFGDYAGGIAGGGGGSLGKGGDGGLSGQCGYLGGGAGAKTYDVSGTKRDSGTGGRGALWLFY